MPWFINLGGIALIRQATTPLASLGGVVLLGMSNTLAGWLAHDYVHGRSSWAWLMRPFGELVGGMSTSWWSNKHNMHHALTNEVGYDEDIALDPFLFLWQPDPKNDNPGLRKWQHWYWPIPYSTLFLYWRIDSIRHVFKSKRWAEASRLAIHWAFFSALVPFPLLLASVWFSGLLTATIVTLASCPHAHGAAHLCADCAHPTPPLRDAAPPRSATVARAERPSMLARSRSRSRSRSPSRSRTLTHAQSQSQSQPQPQPQPQPHAHAYPYPHPHACPQPQPQPQPHSLKSPSPSVSTSGDPPV